MSCTHHSAPAGKVAGRYTPGRLAAALATAAGRPEAAAAVNINDLAGAPAALGITPAAFLAGVAAALNAGADQ